MFDFHNPWVAIIQIVLVFVLPALVGLVTERLTSSGIKVALLGGLAFATALLTGLLDALLAGTDYDWLNNVANGLVTWALAIAAHYGVLKPTGATAALQDAEKPVLFRANPR